jgi:hypothetical protein
LTHPTNALAPAPTVQAAGTEPAPKTRPPLAREVLHAVAVEHGVCVRPIAMRRTDLDTGETQIVNVPCGHTLAATCPPCAERKRKLRALQCRTGWHLETEPIIERADPDEQQRWWMTKRAEAQRLRDQAAARGEDTTDLDALLIELDAEIEAAGIVGTVSPGKTARPKRSTRRRRDVADLPRRPVEARTVGRTYAGKEGRTFRPSIFLTLTCDSYGRVRADGTPVDPATYDYARAARDALHFPKLVDRFVQNLRRFCGWEVQYFAAVEPQKRLAPHVHMAIRGTISRAELRQVAAATYHQVWWPTTDEVKCSAGHLPTWNPGDGSGAPAGYVDPDTGDPLPTFDQARQALDEYEGAEPLHVVRFGPQLHAEGVLSDSADSRRCIGYLTKYLVKNVGECHTPTTPAQIAHVDRLAEALRYEPCSPTCANWLRYGIQPKNARPGLTPGYCNGKAHRRQHLGYGGRRVLVSRKWSGKTLADHRADRHTWVLVALATAGISATDRPGDNRRYAWEHAPPTDPDVPPPQQRLLSLIGERIQHRRQLDQARAVLDLSATRAAA